VKKEEKRQCCSFTTEPKFDPFDWDPDNPFGVDDHVDAEPMDDDVRPFKYFCVLFCLCG
jgi:hypothetical protein